MRAIVVPLILAAFLSSNAYAQKYVIELEGIAFNKDVTAAQRKLIEETLEGVPSEKRLNARTLETIAVLRRNDCELFRFKNSVLAGTLEPISQQMDTNSMCLEASFSILARKGDKIEIDCQVAFGYVNHRLTSDLRRASPLTVSLGERELVAAGGGQAGGGRGEKTVAIQQFLLLQVREATEEDLKLRKVSESFEARMHQKRKIPLPGGKLTMR